MSDAVVVNFGGTGAVLGGADRGEREVRMSCDHGVDEFANTTAVAESHLFGKCGLCVGIRVAHMTKEVFHELKAGWKGSRAVGGVLQVQPTLWDGMLLHDLGDVGFDRDLDVVPCLGNINTIEQIDKSHAFQREGEGIVDHVEQDVGGLFGGDSDSKIIHLTHEQDTFPVNHARVEAGFVMSRCEADLPQDFIGVFLPKARRLRVALHGG